MKEAEEEETKSSFLLKNLAKGLLWFAVFIAAFILAQEQINAYKDQITKIGDNMPLLLSIFTVSEIVFGILPPEIFMFIWKTKGVLSEYIINLCILTLISYAAGILGYYIGKVFSKTEFYKRIHAKYLQQYDSKLKKFGGFLVIVGGCNACSIFCHLYVGRLGEPSVQIFFADYHYKDNPLRILWGGCLVFDWEFDVRSFYSVPSRVQRRR